MHKCLVYSILHWKLKSIRRVLVKNCYKKETILLEKKSNETKKKISIKAETFSQVIHKLESISF